MRKNLIKYWQKYWQKRFLYLFFQKRYKKIRFSNKNLTKIRFLSKVFVRKLTKTETKILTWQKKLNKNKIWNKKCLTLASLFLFTFFVSISNDSIPFLFQFLSLWGRGPKEAKVFVWILIFLFQFLFQFLYSFFFASSKLSRFVIHFFFTLSLSQGEEF